MTPQEKKAIGKALPPAGSAVITVALSPEPDAVDTRFQRFCDRFTTVAPQVRIKKDSDTGFAAPALITGRHHNIAYRAVPRGKILDGFLAALLQTAETDAPLDGDLMQALDALSLPADIRLYFAEQCPHCPGAIQTFQALAGSSSKIRLNIIDAGMFQPLAEKDSVRAVPTLIVDDQFRWSGQIDPLEVLRMCIDRDPAQLSPVSLRQLIEEGAAESVARMMIDAGRPFPALVELLAHERWSVRLGAMVTVEYLAESGPSLAGKLVAPLWKRFAQAAPPAQGDMAHVLGQIPAPEAEECLQSIIAGDYEASVVEAAKEALSEKDEP